MSIYVQCGLWYLVHTTHGTEIIDASLIGPAPAESFSVSFRVFAPYCEGKPTNMGYERKEGWCARYSASGYMDCTEWVGPYATEEEAIRECKSLYGDDDENTKEEGNES